MLIVYGLGDQKLINAYLTKNSMQNSHVTLNFFLKLKMMYCQLCLYFFVYIFFILNSFVINSKSAYIYTN